MTREKWLWLAFLIETLAFIAIWFVVNNQIVDAKHDLVSCRQQQARSALHKLLREKFGNDPNIRVMGEHIND